MDEMRVASLKSQVASHRSQVACLFPPLLGEVAAASAADGGGLADSPGSEVQL